MGEGFVSSISLHVASCYCSGYGSFRFPTPPGGQAIFSDYVWSLCPFLYSSPVSGRGRLVTLQTIAVVPWATLCVLRPLFPLPSRLRIGARRPRQQPGGGGADASGAAGSGSSFLHLSSPVLSLSCAFLSSFCASRSARLVPRCCRRKEAVVVLPALCLTPSCLSLFQKQSRATCSASDIGRGVSRSPPPRAGTRALQGGWGGCGLGFWELLARWLCALRSGAGGRLGLLAAFLPPSARRGVVGRLSSPLAISFRSLMRWVLRREAVGRAGAHPTPPLVW